MFPSKIRKELKEMFCIINVITSGKRDKKLAKGIFSPSLSLVEELLGKLGYVEKRKQVELLPSNV